LGKPLRGVQSAFGAFKVQSSKKLDRKNFKFQITSPQIPNKLQKSNSKFQASNSKQTNNIQKDNIQTKTLNSKSEARNSKQIQKL
jgi:hypothetical protein